MSRRFERWRIIIETKHTAEPRRHGVPAPADEMRTAAVCVSAKGEARIVIAARGYALIVDPVEETCRQVWFPDGNKEYPFSCIAASDGTFVVGAGRAIIAIDPFAGSVKQSVTVDCGEEIVGFRLAEAPDGSIYLATYPRCLLIRFDPAAAQASTAARLDDAQKYVFSLACGKDGWVYAGIGTEKHDVVAYHPATEELRRFVPASERRQGSGQVYQAADGSVYGSWSPGQWMRLERGEARPASPPLPPSIISGTGFQAVHGALPEPLRLESVDLAEREVVIWNRETGERKAIQLSYDTDGANLSPLTLGPDGRIYGTSNHPLQLYVYDPETDTLTNYGGRAIERGDGGNICAYASIGPILAGAVYAGGHLHLIDTSRPLQWEEEATRNPKLVASHAEVHRPRCALALADEEHILYGGFPGYGAVGGGLAIYNIKSGADEVIPNERLVPDQSTLCLTQLPDGTIIGGTSIETPGGAEPKAKEAELYILDWERRQASKRWTPIPGAREISLLKAYSESRAAGLTSDALLFIFDAAEGRIVMTMDLAAYGSVVRDGLLLAEDGTLIGALESALFRFDPHRLELIGLWKSPHPITAGLAYQGGRIYYGTGPELYSIGAENL